MCSDAKVCELCLAAVIQHDVRCFDVAVELASGVQVFEPA